MALSGSEKVSVVARNGMPVAHTLDELAASSAYDGLNVIMIGGDGGGAPITVAALKAGAIPEGHSVPQAGTATSLPAADINDHFAPPPASYTGPLDIISGAVVAYGQRALSAAMRGQPLYTIRRDSDDTTLAVSSDATTGDAPISAITSFIGAGNGFVSVWSDQSGNASDVSQDVAASQPKWGGVSGIDFLRTAAVQISTSGDVVLPNTGLTIFAVCDAAAVGGDTIIGMGWDVLSGGVQIGVGQNAFVTAASLIDADGAHSTSWTDQATLPSGTLLLEFATDFASHFDITNDGVAAAIQSDNGDPFTGISYPLTIGNIGFTSPDSGAGIIAEILIYPSLLSDADRLSIRQNIAAYYGITLS